MDGAHEEGLGPRETSAREGSERLDSALTGALPCVTCRYDLKGLSIRTVCPECGTAVRATILWKVDPLAEEFRPVMRPRVLAVGLTLWAGAALVGALANWGLRVAEVVSTELMTPVRPGWLAKMVMLGAGVSALSGWVLIRPVAGQPLRHSLSALAGWAAYGPLLFALWRIHMVIDDSGRSPFVDGAASVDRTLMRLLAGVSMIAIILGMRPSARDLVKRSLVMRTGRVDRQTLLVLAGVVGLTTIGDVLRWWSASSAAGSMGEFGVASLVGTLIIALGSGLLTVGLVGATVDSWRIGRAVLIPSPSLKQVLGPA